MLNIKDEQLLMDKKLILVPKKFKTNETTIVSARISIDLMKKIDLLAKKANMNRNEIIQILLNYAVDNTFVQDKEDKEKEGN